MTANELQTLEVVTLFVDDLGRARAFYERVFSPDIVYRDAVSAVMRFGPLMVNLLQSTEAPGLVAPLPVALSNQGSRCLFTIKVQDVDAICLDLQRNGVALLNGPIDQPLGRRTAAFADPDGFVLEVAQEV